MRAAVAAVVLLLLASPALASEEASSTFLGLPRPIWYVANLLAFAGLLVYLLAKPLSRFFHARREEIARSIADAARQREEAARMKVEMDQKVASLQDEIAALRERILREGEREKEQLAKQGEAEAERLLAQLDQEASRRVDEARVNLASEAASVAADLAWELLEKELTPEDRQRIFRRTLDKLTSGTSGGEA